MRPPIRLRFLLGLLGLLGIGTGRAGEPAGFVRPPLRLLPPQATPDGLHLRWDVPGTGWRFAVDTREDLGSGTWSPSTPEPLPDLREWTDPRPSVESRWYRVRAVVPEVPRGEVVAVETVTTFGRPLLQAIFAGASIPVTPKNDVRFLRVTYRTVDPYGLPTTATGGLALPVGSPDPLPLVSYQHGTVLSRSDVPSSLNTESLVGLAFAADGYAAALPDYLGLGGSPGFHPYHLARSEATAVIDLLRATRTVCDAEAQPLDGRVFLLGYSQGGHATAAALREIETRHPSEFAVTAAAPMAGAFDLSGTSLDDALSDRIPPNPYYLVYLLAAAIEYHRFVPSLASILRPPWDTMVPPLVTLGDGDALNAALPPVPSDALDPAFLAAVRSDPGHPLRLALRENDLLDWAPKAPVRLMHCSGDRDVLPVNSALAQAAWISNGATGVTRIDPDPGAAHGECAIPALLAAKAWFDTYR